MPDSQLTLAQQVALCQQVARLVRAKLPITGELARMAEGKSTTVAQTARSVDQQLSSGISLENALASADTRESRTLAACIETGEKSGKLNETLEIWTEMHLSCTRYSKALRTAMIYPVLLIAVTLLSLGYVIWQLIPEYRTTYSLFQTGLPPWLELLVGVRERLGLLMLLLLFIALLPLALWIWYRRSFDAHGLPRESARRLQIQALATDLIRIGISSGMPLNQLVPSSVIASGGSKGDAERAFCSIQQRHTVSQLPRETSILVGSLHAGIVSPAEAAQHLSSVADHFRLHADVLAARSARWLPMLVSLTVGFLTIFTYVVLIYLPWILLLQRIVTPEALGV